VSDLPQASMFFGDCLSVMAEMPMASVSAVVTDPPFSSGTRKEGQKGIRKSMNRGVAGDEWFGSDSLTTNGFTWLMRECAVQWQRLLKSGGHVLCFIDWRMMPALAGAIESADLRHAGLVVWDKTYFGMGACFRNQHEMILHFTKGVAPSPERRNVGNVLSFKPIRHGSHPTEKPVDLLSELIAVVSRPGDTILDPFSGSGSTGVAALKSGRNFVGIERDRRYFDDAQKRLAETPAAVIPIDAGLAERKRRLAHLVLKANQSPPALPAPAEEQEKGPDKPAQVGRWEETLRSADEVEQTQATPS
jgi:site-specific DNA-methyltransferase (adenine-specific)